MYVRNIKLTRYIEPVLLESSAESWNVDQHIEPVLLNGDESWNVDQHIERALLNGDAFWNVDQHIKPILLECRAETWNMENVVLKLGIWTTY